MMKRIVTTCLLAGALAFHALPALADPAEEGSVHFQRGVELYREGDLKAALVEFKRANELSPSFRILYNIGQAEAQLGNYLEAIHAFEQYLNAGGSQIPTARRTEVSEDLARLRLRIGTVMVTSNVSGAVLLIDGVAHGKLPLTEKIPLNVGQHRIELQDGERRQSATIELPGGETKNVELNFAPRAVNVTLPPTIEVEKNYAPMWISFGIAAAATASAVTFGLLAFDRDKDHENELERTHTGTYDADDKASTIKTFSLVSDISTAVAAVSAGVGIYFLIRPPTRTTTTAPQVGLGPGSFSILQRF